MNENMLPIGTLLRGGTYQIERQIASGGFGNTYAVRNVKFDELYAMKEFFMKGVNLRNGIDVTVSVADNKATFETQRKKFEKEAMRLRKLNNEHIVKVHDLFDENGTVYYVMDYIDGLSLTDILKLKGAFDEQTALKIFRQMLDALSVVHGQNPPMLHLDIKPANIMLDNKGKAYLLDFGSSKQIDSDDGLTTVSGFTLSKAYAPSELIDGQKNRIGPWTDLYELGATLHHLLTGKQPPSVSMIQEDGISSFNIPNHISTQTRELVIWLMSTNRRERPKSVEEVLQRIEKPEIESTNSKAPLPETIKSARKEEIKNNTDDDKTILDSPDMDHKKKPIVAQQSKEESRKRNVTASSSNYRLWGLVGGILLLIAISSFFFTGNKDSDADLKTTVDTMSYAIGMAQTQGLKEYLVGTLGVDTTYIDDFIKGLHEGVDAGDAKDKVSYYAGIQVGQQIGSKMIPGINSTLFGEDSTKTVSFDHFMAGFINGALGDESLMTIDSAQVLSNKLLGTTDSEEDDAGKEQN